MPFKENDKNINRQGRPKGMPNKINAEIKQFVAALIQKKLPELEAAFDKLNARDKCKFFIDLLPYFVPRMQNVEMKVDYENLSYEQLEFIVGSLLNANIDETLN